MVQALEILKQYITCEDSATRNKFFNLLDSFWHKNDGHILKSHTIDQAGNLTFTFVKADGSTFNVNLPALPNSKPISFITNLQETLNDLVTKVPGKGLSSNDLTTELLNKLNSLQNYQHPQYHQIGEVEGLPEALEGKADAPAEGYGFSQENFSLSEKEKISKFDASHYAAPVDDLNALAAIPQAEITTKQRRYVHSEGLDYFYDAQRSTGDIAPGDQTNGTGFWVKSVGVGGNAVQSDWRETNESSASFIKNKPKEEGQIPFISKWNVVEGETVSLPVGVEGINDVKVDWGDGTINYEYSHTYSDAGEKLISISGRLEDFRFNENSSSRLSIIEVVQWGDIEWRNISFRYCENLGNFPVDQSPNLLRCTSLFNFMSFTAMTHAYKATFKHIQNVVDMQELMVGSPIISLEDGIFDNAINLVNGYKMFKYCDFTSLPSGLFKNSPNLTNLGQFCMESSLQIVPADLLISTHALTNLSGAFRDAPINTIPKEFLWGCLELRNVSQMLYGTQITSLDKDFFKFSTKIENFHQMCRTGADWTSPVPPFWMDFPDAVGTEAFTLRAFPNVDEIPMEWGGNNAVWATEKGVVTKHWTGSQAAYDALPQSWKDDATIIKYIKEDPVV